MLPEEYLPPAEAHSEQVRLLQAEMRSEEGQQLQAGRLQHREDRQPHQADQPPHTEGLRAQFHAVQAELQYIAAAIHHRAALRTAEVLPTIVHLIAEAHHRAGVTLHLADQATAPVLRAEATAEAARAAADTAEAVQEDADNNNSNLLYSI